MNTFFSSTARCECVCGQRVCAAGGYFYIHTLIIFSFIFFTHINFYVYILLAQVIPFAAFCGVFLLFD